MRKYLITLIVLAFALTGCRGRPAQSAALPIPPLATPPTPTLSPSEKMAVSANDIAGTWLGSYGGGPAYLIVDNVGNFIFSQTPDGSGGWAGTYAFEGTKVLIKLDLPLGGCGLDSTGYYEIRMQQDAGSTKSIQFHYIDDICDQRIQALMVDTAEWVRQ